MKNEMVNVFPVGSDFWILFEYLIANYNVVAFTPVYLAGNLASMPFNTYDAKKLYVGNISSSVDYINFFNPLNVQDFQFNNLQNTGVGEEYTGNLTDTLVMASYTTIPSGEDVINNSGNTIFSRITCPVGYLKFIGFVVTIE